MCNEFRSDCHFWAITDLACIIFECKFPDGSLDIALNSLISVGCIIQYLNNSNSANSTTARTFFADMPVSSLPGCTAYH